MGRLIRNVFVGGSWYGPAYGNADSVPAEVAEQIGDLAWDTQAAPEVIPAVVPGQAPPRAGRGSGRDAWAAYAASLGVEVPGDATREDIIAAVDKKETPDA